MKEEVEKFLETEYAYYQFKEHRYQEGVILILGGLGSLRVEVLGPDACGEWFIQLCWPEIFPIEKCFGEDPVECLSDVLTKWESKIEGIVEDAISIMQVKVRR